MSYSNGLLPTSSTAICSQRGLPGVGFQLTDDGNYDINGKRLTDVADSIDDGDAVSLKVLKEHTQVSQNNYHLQPSFKIYKNFGDKSQLTVSQPPNVPSNHFFNSHKSHHDAYIIEKEDDDSGFYGEAWSNMMMKDNQLERGTYTAILEIFVIGDAGGFLVDDTIIYQVWGDNHYKIITFDSDKINSQYTGSMIQFTTDGGGGSDNGIKFQIKYFGSQYNKNIKFLFYSRVIKGKQSTSFNHTIFNVLDAQDNHKILYFENLNLNGNLIDGLGDPVHLDSATNKKYVDIENAKQDIAIANKANKSYVDGEIAKVHIDTTPLLPRDGSRSMFGNLDMGTNHILSVENLTDYKDDDAYEVRVRDLRSVVNKEYLNEKFLKKDMNDNYFDLKQNVIKNCEPYHDGLFDDNSLVSKAFVDDEISKLPKPATDVLKLDGSKAMTGSLNMGDHSITGIRSSSVDNAVLTVGGAKATYLPLSGDRSMQNNLNMDGFTIRNIKPFVEDDSSQAASDAQKNEVINFGYFHTERGELKRLINDVAYDALNRKNPDPMEDDIHMANHNITNLKDPQPSDASHAASVDFVNTSINHSNTRISDIIDEKIKASETHSIDSIDKENVFKIVMDDDEFKEDDDDIHKIGVKDKNFHSVNKKTYEFKIDYDPSIGYYSTRLSIDLIYLPVGSYTMVYEMYVDDGMTIDEIDALSGTLSVGKINSRIDETNTRSIIHFTKNMLRPGFDDLDIDIKLKSKTDPQTTIYVVVYGVKGSVNDVSVNLWDRLFYHTEDSIKYEVGIDMGNHAIVGLKSGTNPTGAVNYKQLVDYINLINSYYYYTTNLFHKDEKSVIFKENIINHPIVIGYINSKYSYYLRLKIHMYVVIIK